MTADVIPGTCRRCWPVCFADCGRHCQSSWRERRTEHGGLAGEQGRKSPNIQRLFPNWLQITHYISLQTEQEPRGGGEHLSHAANPSRAGPAPNLDTTVSLVSPWAVVSPFLRKWLVGASSSIFSKAFTAVALPLLPPTITDYLEMAAISQ